MANFVTGIRVVCGIILLFVPADSKWFYAFYLSGGITDAVDGVIARRMGQCTDFGAKFDTAADIVFIMCASVKVISVLNAPVWILIWIGAIICRKIMNIVHGMIIYNQFTAVHSVWNKICGVIIFVTLLIVGKLPYQAMLCVMIFACAAATIAAILEGFAVHKESV